MEKNKAIQILIEAVELAQKRGAYTLLEAGQILEAAKVFVKQEAPKEESKEEVKEEVKS